VALLEGNLEEARVLFEESLRTYREMGDQPGIACAEVDLGRLTLKEGEAVESRSLFVSSLTARHRRMDRKGMAVCLQYLAAWEVSTSRKDRAPAAAVRAARLLAAAEALRDSLRLSLRPYERADLESAMTFARTHLDEEAFAAAWAEGHAMTLEQAVAYAIRANQETR
jgi:hypothetical protein